MYILRLSWNRFLLGLLLCAAFLSFAFRVCTVGEITVTKDDSFADSNNNGKVEAGETIEYTITIENIGNEDASNINLEDILSPNLTLVPNSVVVAKDDLYGCVGNTDLDVDSENGVLTNDLDPENAALAVTRLNGNTNLSGTTTYGGSVQMMEDGSFVYIPPARFRGPMDNFSYTVTDGNGNSANATVIINISEMVWFVDNKAPPGGDGRSFSPFSSLAFLNDPNDVDEPGDFIFIFEGLGVYNGGLELEAGQRLIGQGTDLVVSGKTLQTVSGCTISRFVNHGNANGITVYGTKAGTMSLAVSSSLFSNEDQDGGNAGIFLEARSDYQAMLVVDDAGGLVNDSVFEKISGSAIVTAAIDSSIVTTRIRESIFRNAHGDLGNNAIDISAGGIATTDFIVENNILDTLMRVSTFAGTVGFGSISSRKMTGKIRNNDLDNTRGSAYGSIISDLSSPTLDVTINNNHADDVARYGLRVRLDETASGTVRASGNQLGTVSPVGNDSRTRDGIEIRSRDNTGDYYVSLKNNLVFIDGSIGKAIDIDSEDNTAIYLDVREGNIFNNVGGGRDFDAETEDPESEICLKLTGHTSGTFELIETAGNFKVESLITIHTDNPGAAIYIGSGVESTPVYPIHPAEPADT